MAQGVEYMKSDLQLPRVFVHLGSLVNFSYPTNPQRSAIVNSTNNTCLGGSGVDAAITIAGGDNLRVDREALPVLRAHQDPRKVGRCKTGDAVITGPNQYGHLKTTYVIHAVGPNYNSPKYRNGEKNGDIKLLSYNMKMSN